MSKHIAYYRHTVRTEPPIKYEGPVPAHRKPIPPVEKPFNTYRLYGLDFLKHPWRETHDYSRIRALAREASIRWPGNATQIVVDSPRIGNVVPIIQFRRGVEHRWRGA